MEFEVILNKDAAFIDYINILLNNQTYFIPEDLKKPLNNLYNIDVKYNEEFKKIKQKYIKNIDAFVEDAHVCFIKYWKLNYDELCNEKKIVNNILKIYGQNIAKTIQNITKIPWKKSSIKIILTLRSGGMSDENIIFIGVNRKFRSLYIETLIHELVHSNTRQIISKIKYLDDEEEIATTIITNKIIRYLNEKYKTKVKQQEFSYNLKYKNLERYQNNFVDDSESFIEILEICSDRKNHKMKI